MSDVEEPEICNCLALRQASRRVTAYYDRVLAPVGLGVNQYTILSRLGRVGATRIQELARPLVMDRSTLGHLLRPLEQRGLVAIEVNAADRRSRDVALTAAGRALLPEARALWSEGQGGFERAFGSGAALELRTVLKRVARLDLGASAGRSADERL